MQHAIDDLLLTENDLQWYRDHMGRHVFEYPRDSHLENMRFKIV